MRLIVLHRGIQRVNIRPGNIGRVGDDALELSQGFFRLFQGIGLHGHHPAGEAVAPDVLSADPQGRVRPLSQHHPGLGRQGGVDVGETVGDVFMYRTLRYPKLFRRLAHRSILVYDVIGDLDRPFFDIFLHGSSPGNVLYII